MNTGSVTDSGEERKIVYIKQLRVSNLRSITTSSDEVFGDNTAEELRMMTPTMSGNAEEGYSAKLVIGLTR